MKKKLYYITPFAAIPISLLLCALLDYTNILPMSPYILSAILLLLSAVAGIFSPTHRTFDCLVSALMPLSLFCCMFVAGFLDKNDLEARFNLYKAVNAAFQPMVLQLYFLMAIVTFLASFKYFRNLKKL